MKSLRNIFFTLALCAITSHVYSMSSLSMSPKDASKEENTQTWEEILEKRWGIGTCDYAAAVTCRGHELASGSLMDYIRGCQETNPTTCAGAATKEETAVNASAQSALESDYTDAGMPSGAVSPAVSLSDSFGSISPSFMPMYHQKLSPAARSLCQSAHLSSRSNRAALPAAATQSDESDADSNSSSHYHTTFETPLTSPSEESASTTLDIEGLNARLIKIAHERRHGFELDLSVLDGLKPDFQ